MTPLGQGVYSKKSLFAKLQENYDRKDIRLKSLEESKRELLESIKSNLEFLLNARMGCTACAPQLGLEDFNDANFSAQDLFMRIVHDIRRNIQEYEPRVSVTNISFVPNVENPLDLNFRVACQIKSTINIFNEEINLYLNGLTKQLKVR